MTPAANPASWYVVHTKPRQEFRALEELQNQHFDCFLPTLEVEKKRGRKLVTLEEPLFSRYLFIRLDAGNSKWTTIRSTRGVSSLLTFGSRYATLADSWIEACQNAPSAVRQHLFTPGDLVSITAGPFSGFEGRYAATDGETRALILIELMSQPQKLLFSIDMLRKTA